ncbi:MAG: hypothetical protein JWM10_3011 [Myxococcaceae bacterium]|nr:hypothetical protein [Myxococcaceae bacterium]
MTEPSPKKPANPRLLLLAVDLGADEGSDALVARLAERYAQDLRFCVERGAEGARVVVGEARSVTLAMSLEEFVAAFGVRP